MDERMIESVEQEPTYTTTVIGRLGDLGIGNPDGVPTKYKNEAIEAVQAESAELLQRLIEPSDLHALACMDGRHRKCNADGSQTETRLRRVGGSASNFGVALNADAPIADTLNSTDSLGAKIHKVDTLVAQETGFGRSAHLGGCGGANGEIGDHEAIHTNPAILKVTEAIMEIPQVKAYLETSFDADLAERVRANAGVTAQVLKAEGWDGQTYVDGVVAENPGAVEDLEVDHEDHRYHGHRENTLVIIIGDKTLDMDDAFVWSLKATKAVAEALAQGESMVYTQAVIADIAKHVAVANRLPSTATPVVLLSDR